MNLNIVVLPGDGVGPEVTEQAVRVLREIAGTHGHNFYFEEHPAGGEAIARTGSPMPRATLDACLAADAALLGAIGSPEFDHLPSAQKPEAGLLLLRRTLGGFANLRPVSFHKAWQARLPCERRSPKARISYLFASYSAASISVSRAASLRKMEVGWPLIRCVTRRARLNGSRAWLLKPP